MSQNASDKSPKRVIEKAPDAFRNISEVSAQLDVPAYVLRFWETRFSQVRPVKRSGGRRYYRPSDIALLTRIRDLLYGEGYTIKGAQQVLKSKGNDGGGNDGAAVSAPEGSDHAASTPAPAPDHTHVLELLHDASTRLARLEDG